ncbi:hypothetical protein ACFSJ3_06980 [Corallincola platygyrae]|uniref:Uncharacterized protein n=1 Tax=Corallincola platygyrae TaxID=1193278 RepID=A0ABW4XMN2_9GAMM
MSKGQVVGIICCILLSIVAARFGWSSVNAVMVERKTSYWSVNPEKVTHRMALKNSERARVATQLQPLNAHHWFLRGKAAEWSAFTSKGDDVKQEWLKKASQHYLKSYELRPTWPNTTLALADLSLTLPASDFADFDSYFSQSFANGRYKRDVAWGLLAAGLKGWSRANGKTKKLVLNLIEDQLPGYNHRSKLMVLAEQKAQKKLVCTVWRVKFNGQKWEPCTN